MPPRRTTRSVSVEAQPIAKDVASGSKRKRAPIRRVGDDEDTDDQDSQANTGSSARTRGSRRAVSASLSARSSENGANTTRQKSTKRDRVVSQPLEKVTESSEEAKIITESSGSEEDGSRRPIKKARSSSPAEGSDRDEADNMEDKARHGKSKGHQSKTIMSRPEEEQHASDASKESSNISAVSSSSEGVNKTPEPREQERSLLDTISSPSKVVSPTSPKKSDGPEKRLIIHKMALVNFKSYAGRQDIGPFHKVGS
jgi:structural maintenance of chromosome 4